jgi:serine protease DegS
LRIDEVIGTSPAGRAGLTRGDVLIKVNGREVSEADLWTLRESMRRPDASFAVTVMRDGKPVEVTFTTARMI